MTQALLLAVRALPPQEQRRLRRALGWSKRPQVRGQHTRMPSTPEERAQAEALLAEGLDVEEVAQRLGRHPGTVREWGRSHLIRYLGVRPRPTPEEWEHVSALLASGRTLQQVADAVGRNKQTISAWLARGLVRR